MGNAVFDAAAAMGVKELRWFPSASFPCHAPVLEHLENRVIHHIEGSMNGPLGDYCSQGKRAYYIASTIQAHCDYNAPADVLERLSAHLRE